MNYKKWALAQILVGLLMIMVRIPRLITGPSMNVYGYSGFVFGLVLVLFGILLYRKELATS